MKHTWVRNLDHNLKGIISEEETDYDFKKNNTRTKSAVLGLADRASKKIEVSVFPETNGKSIRKVINERVQPGSELHTDESFRYRTGLDNFIHKSVKHAKGNWVVNVSIQTQLRIFGLL